MRKYKALALVFGGKESGDPMVVIPLNVIRPEEYEHWKNELGTPVGRMETFLDLT